MYQLIDSDKQFYQDNGVVLLKQAISPEWITTLQQGVAKNFASPSQYACFYTPKGSPGAFYDDYCNWQRIEEYKQFIFESNIGNIAGQLLAPTPHIRLFHEHVLVKEPGSWSKTPWHQDYPYYCVDGDEGVSFWIPLDEIDATSQLSFIAGSHQWGQIFEPQKFNGKDQYDIKTNQYSKLPNIDKEIENYTILSWPMQPGDIIAFNFKTIHGNTTRSQPSKYLRRAFSCRCLGANMTYTTRPGEKSPPFPNLGLEPGSSLAHKQFPIIWES